MTRAQAKVFQYTKMTNEYKSGLKRISRTLRREVLRIIKIYSAATGLGGR